tara:strand:+ start:38593 stop:39114 length:522 start_codon:yes stop_codon:yes gene_type:complete
MAQFVKALFLPQSFNIQETVKAFELQNNNRSITSSQHINDILIEKIKNKLGNKCNSLGYIDKNSIKLISRTIGNINTSHFNGDIHYNVVVEASVCHPSEGNKLICNVIGKNKIGIFAVAEPIHVIIAAAHHENTDIFNDIETNDRLEIEIINYKFKLNAENIKVIGKFIKKIN